MRATDDLLRLTATYLGSTPTIDEILEFAPLLKEQTNQLLTIVGVDEEVPQARAT